MEWIVEQSLPRVHGGSKGWIEPEVQVSSSIKNRVIPRASSFAEDTNVLNESTPPVALAWLGSYHGAGSGMAYPRSSSTDLPPRITM